MGEDELLRLIKDDEGKDVVEKLFLENKTLRSEIKVAHEAADITTQLVIDQFEKAEFLMFKFRSTSSFLEAVMDAALQMAIIATELNGKVTLFNKGAELMLGYTVNEAMSMNFIDIVGVNNLPEACHNLFLETNKLQDDIDCQITSNINEGFFYRRDGSLFPVSYAITPIKTDDKILGYLIIAMDISSLKSAEESLKQAYEEISMANERLQKLDKLKSEFLSSVSHELRTPLTSIRGFSKLIGKDFSRFFVPLVENDPQLKNRADKIADNLGIILSESERLTRLINDVLDLSKIESQKVEWSEAPIDMIVMLRQAVNAAMGQFNERENLELIVDLPESLPIVYGDYDRLVQVVVNLLNNASKFTTKGFVRISAFRRDDGYIQVDIKDTGCGFSPEDAEAVFDKFRQVSREDTLADKPQGTGLGLTICQEIINRFGGKIWATSAINVGSTFSFILPIMLGNDDSSEELELVKDDNSKLILVVDDETSIRSLLSQFFKSYGFKVITAENGKVAIDLAHKYTPDLITMDLSMPIMDGSEAISILKKHDNLKHIPVIVLSAFNDMFSAKGDLVFDKPINEQRLIDSVFMLIHKDKFESTHACLVVCNDHRNIVNVPNINISHYDVCRIDELPVKLKHGFKGLIMIPSDILDEVDMLSISNHEDVQLLIIPNKYEDLEK